MPPVAAAGDAVSIRLPGNRLGAQAIGPPLPDALQAGLLLGLVNHSALGKKEPASRVTNLDQLVMVADTINMASVTLTPEAVEQADQLPEKILERVRKLLRRLAQWPEVSGVKALSGNLAGRYRMRTGDYRVRFYVVRSESGKEVTVLVDKIGHRSKFYEGED